MTANAAVRRPLGADDAVLTEADIKILLFITEMGGVQLDQVAALLANRGEPADSAAYRARELVTRWRAGGYTDTGHLSLGEPWVWATRKGQDICGLRTRMVKPATKVLRHTHAVTHVRLAVERTSSWSAGSATWRAERSILAEIGFHTRAEHTPDGEVHWPAGTESPWAGEIWAVEVEVTPKSIEHTAGIMQEVLTRTTGYDSPLAIVPEPGQPPRYARLAYVCSRASVRTVLNARTALGTPLSARITVYDLPEAATRLNSPKRGWGND